MPESTLAGVDAGATKTHLRVERAGAVLLDEVVPTGAWRRTPTSVGPEDAAALWSALGSPEGPVRLVVGAHGIDTADAARALASGLAAHCRGSVSVHNDAVLLGPAAGSRGVSIAIVAGTGAIVLAADGAGVLATRGGYGFLLGDEGSAASLVRDLAVALTRAADAGAQDPVALEALAASLGVPAGADRLAAVALALHDRAAPAVWGRHAPAVFDAAASGSASAAGVIAAHAAVLGGHVASLVAAGHAPDVVVAAGGVATHQPGFVAAVQEAARAAGAAVTIEVLRRAPVAGAIELARRGED